MLGQRIEFEYRDEQMTIINYDPQPRYDPEFERNVIQPLLVLSLHGGIAPANKIIH